MGDTTVQKLIEQLCAFVEPFLDQYKEVYAKIRLGERRSVICPVKDDKFHQHMSTLFRRVTGEVPTENILKRLQENYLAIAHDEQKTYPLEIRVAVQKDAFRYNLGNGNVVYISEDFWDKFDWDEEPLFREWDHLLPQAEPEGRDPENFKKLLKYVNLKEDEQKLLFLVVVLSCFVPDIQHPVIVLHGHQGSAKTTTAKLIRQLVDPTTDNPYILTANQYEMALQITQNYVILYDNLDGLNKAQSNLLCQAVSGGSAVRKQNWTDKTLARINFGNRVVVLNGINLVARKSDLLDRAVIFELARITENQRRSDNEFWAEFKRDLPEILGGAFEIISRAKKIHTSLKLEKSPRLSDFFRWGCAIALVLGYSVKEFADALNKNAITASEHAVEANPVSFAIDKLMQETEEWKNTMGVLYKTLTDIASTNSFVGESGWPKSPSTLSERIREIQPDLEKCGITIETKKTKYGREITIRRKTVAVTGDDSDE